MGLDMLNLSAAICSSIWRYQGIARNVHLELLVGNFLLLLSRAEAEAVHFRLFFLSVKKA